MQDSIVVHRVQIGLCGLLAIALVCSALRDVAIAIVESKK